MEFEVSGIPMDRVQPRGEDPVGPSGAKNMKVGLTLPKLAVPPTRLQRVGAGNRFATSEWRRRKRHRVRPERMMRTVEVHSSPSASE